MKMKSSRKKFIAVLSMTLGIMIFAGAAFANYSTANGYEVGKTALKNLLKNENYTSDMNLRLTLDGNEVASISSTEVYDRDGDVVLNSSTEEKSMYGGYSLITRTKQDNVYISTYKFDSEEPSTSVYYNDTYRRMGNFDSMSDRDEDDIEMAQKIIRFAELFGDTMVGDLKNNVVYVSREDDLTTYEINLDAVQIPELVNAGLSVIFSEISTSGYDDDEPFAALGSDPIVKSASLKFTVDEQVRLTDCTANVTMSGNGREAAIDLSLKMSYGTAAPERVDIETLPNVSRYNYSEDKGHTKMSEDEYIETVNYYAPEASNEASVSVIGGADGPTAVYVTSEVKEADHVDEDGNVIDHEGNIIGEIEINDDGEGTVKYFVEK